MSEIIPEPSAEGKVDSRGDSASIDSPESDRSILDWLALNLGLLLLYIGFFHLCLVTWFPLSLVIGLIIATVMTLLCVTFYRVFVNRYEFLFYLALPLDVVLEGLIPLHSGYSFYWCAAAFWLVFVTYRVGKKNSIGQTCLIRGNSP